MKKIVKKTAAKKPMAKKPMMKSGGAKKSLRRYQGDEGGSEVKAPNTPTQRTFAQAYQENLDAGIRPGQAKRIAMVETGVKEQKKRVDPNAIINAVGNTAGAAGSLINAIKPDRSSSGPTNFKRGGSTKKTMTKKPLSKAQKGGTKKNLTPVNTKPNLPKPSTFPKKTVNPTLTMEQNYGVAGKYGPKTESDTKIQNWINSVGKGPEKPIPFQKKGGATKRKMAKGGTKYSANNTGATYQMGYKKGGTVSKIKKVTSRTKKK